jgi:hypothetical protein
MKKFLAATLVSAMVLSMAVPAMAADGRVASNTEYAMNQSTLETATKKVEDAQKAFNEATAKYNAAKAALAKAEKAAKDKAKTETPVTADQVATAENNAKGELGAINSAQSTYDGAVKAYNKAKAAEQEALTDYVGKKSAYESAKKATKAAKEAYEAATDVDERAELKLAYDAAVKVEAETKAEAEAAKNVYDGQPDLTKDGKDGLVGKTKIKKDEMEDAGELLDAEKKRADDLLTKAYETEAKYNEQQTGKSSIDELKAKVAETEKAAIAAKEALDAAKNEQAAAAAKLSEAGRKVAKENLEKAQIAEYQKALEEEQALEALKGGKSRVAAIEATIAEYEADIAAFDDAVAANADAQKASDDAAIAVIEAMNALEVANYVYELAAKDDADVARLLAEAEANLREKMSDPDYLTSPELAKYWRAQQAVANAEAAVNDYETWYPEATGNVLVNATAALEKAQKAYDDALAAWDAAKRDAVSATRELQAAFKKYQAAIRALYETQKDDLGKARARVIYGKDVISDEDFADATFVVYAPVAAKENADGSLVLDPDKHAIPTTTSIYRYQGAYYLYNEKRDAAGNTVFDPTDGAGNANIRRTVELRRDFDATGVERTGDNAYVFTAAAPDDEGRFTKNGVPVYSGGRVANNVILDWTAEPITVTNTDSRLSFGDPLKDDITTVYNEDGSVKYEAKRNATLVKNPTNIPTTLYSMLDAAKAAVDTKKSGLQDKYDAAVKAHAQAAKALGEAEAEYEYYYGNKASEEPINPAVENIVGGFVDVATTDWFAPYVADVVDKGLMKGYADGKHFGSYDQLQRQDFVVILWRMAGTPVVNQALSFKDVQKGSYYEDAVKWAYSTGVAKGYNADEFGVGKNITREDFTVMLHRYNGYPGTKAGLSAFDDASKVSGYAVDAVKWAVATGAITGKNDGTIIDPQAAIARCEAAKILSVITG